MHQHTEDTHRDRVFVFFFLLSAPSARARVSSLKCVQDHLSFAVYNPCLFFLSVPCRSSRFASSFLGFSPTVHTLGTCFPFFSPPFLTTLIMTFIVRSVVGASSWLLGWRDGMSFSSSLFAKSQPRLFRRTEDFRLPVPISWLLPFLLPLLSSAFALTSSSPLAVEDLPMLIMAILLRFWFSFFVFVS